MAHQSIFEIAAAYWYHISQAHAFADGNKRTACIACSMFLELNGFLLECSNDELYQVGMDIATGKMSENELVSWLKTKTKGDLGLYLHGTDGASAQLIKLTGLHDGSYVTLPNAIDPATGKPAIMLNPREFSRFVSQPRPGTGDWFALMVAPSKSVQPQGLTGGGAPQFRIHGEHSVTNVFKNPN